MLGSLQRLFGCRIVPVCGASDCLQPAHTITGNFEDVLGPVPYRLSGDDINTFWPNAKLRRTNFHGGFRKRLQGLRLTIKNPP